jgi:hypothetical protein
MLTTNIVRIQTNSQLRKLYASSKLFVDGGVRVPRGTCRFQLLRAYCRVRGEKPNRSFRGESKFDPPPPLCVPLCGPQTDDLTELSEGAMRTAERAGATEFFGGRDIATRARPHTQQPWFRALRPAYAATLTRRPIACERRTANSPLTKPDHARNRSHPQWSSTSCAGLLGQH